MIKRYTQNKFRTAMVMSFILLLASSIYTIWQIESVKVKTLTVAAGPKNSLSYQMLEAISKIANRDYNLNIALIATLDGEENAKLIEKGLVQMATLPAKNLNGELPRLVANLHPDSYQLFVHDSSDIHSFTDLKGKKIALHREGGTDYEAFWEVAKHYGMSADDVNIYTSSDKGTAWMFLNDQVDAVFMLRAPGDIAISNIVRQSAVRFISIDQVEGIRVTSPTRTAHQIPKGVYHGNPAVPAKDIVTISENELLIASKHLDPDIVEILSTVLFEDRKKLTNLVAMAAFIQQPKKDSEQLIPIHEGVRAFWERTEPSFLQKNADLIALTSSFAFAIFTFVMWHRTKKRRQVLNRYNRQLVDFVSRIKRVKQREELKEKINEFDAYLFNLATDTENGKINMEDFGALTFYHEAAIKAVEERRAALEGALT